LYGRDLRSSGTLPFFKQIVLLNGDFKSDLSMQPGSASVVLAISNDPMGIGYSGIGFQTSSVRIVPLADHAGGPFIHPTAGTVMTGTYPLSRPLYLYVNLDPDETPDPKISEFLNFANSHEGQEAILQAGVFPLTAAQVADNLRSLTGRSTATAAIGVRGADSAN
jgi:phosphate transport system substrate-binding protein